nr:MAG TPA: hypothetical protein [Bacteriophage sp.]
MITIMLQESIHMLKIIILLHQVINLTQKVIVR